MKTKQIFGSLSIPILLLGLLLFTAEIQAHRQVMSTNGMVTAQNPLAAQAGIRALLKGGNAFDAAVATAAALSVVEPHFSSIGGTGYMIIYDAERKQIKAMDFVGPSPRGARIDMFNEQTVERGVLSATVPASLAAWVELLAKYGTMSLGELLKPAIEYAENGAPVNEDLNSYIRRYRDHLLKYPTSARLLFDKGQPLEVGQLLVQKDLARTLRAIALQGADVFYKGEIADAIAKFSKDNGGLITKEDLVGYKPRWVEPIHTSYRGYEIYTLPPTSSGVSLLQMLNILEGFDLGRTGRLNPDTFHLIVEAIKLAYEDDEKYITDPDFADIPIEMLLSKNYAGKKRSRIKLDKALSVGSNPFHSNRHETGTTHLTVIDKKGNIVSMTNTIALGFGSGVVFGDTGVFLSDAMLMLSLDKNHINRIEGWKRPRLISVPTIVFKGSKPFMALGAMGGYTQVQAALWTIINAIDFKMDIQNAIDAPRIAYGTIAHHRDTTVYFDENLPDQIRRDLARRGHSLKVGFVGNANGIMIHPTTGVYMGGADSRREGHAIGY